MAILSSLLPKNRPLTRETRCGLMTSFVGNQKFPCVHREAVKVSAGEESIALSAGVVKDESLMLAEAKLYPFERALLPDPDVTDDQDGEEDQHLKKTEQSERFELYGPGEEEDRFHVEHHKENGDDVETHRISSARVVHGIDAALVGHQLGLVGIIGAHQLRQQQRQGKQRCDDHDEDEDGDVVLRHRNIEYSTQS